jgi:hypothetical protein
LLGSDSTEKVGALTGDSLGCSVGVLVGDKVLTGSLLSVAVGTAADGSLVVVPPVGALDAVKVGSGVVLVGETVNVGEALGL